jgi:hypothetical protein
MREAVPVETRKKEEIPWLRGMQRYPRNQLRLHTNTVRMCECRCVKQRTMVAVTILAALLRRSRRCDYKDDGKGDGRDDNM